jgi:biotin transport system substrate-specific component
MRNDIPVPGASPVRLGAARRGLAVAAGALVVALAAQVAVPVPMSPVPMTLQPLAVLAVGGVLGARAGAGALALYLALGALGLPVFAGGAAGVAKLLGATGGYLLAFPPAAALTGLLVGRTPRVGRTLLGCAAGLLVIHLGGVAQLALLGGDPALAVRIGLVPFLAGDLLKVGLAAAAILAVGDRLSGSR